MKRVFLLGVIVYAALLLLLQHWPSAVNETGIAAAPWMGLMLVDGAFAVMALIKMFPHIFDSDDEDEDATIHPDDVSVPDAWFYGLVGVYLLANFGWHAYEFATLTGATSFYFSLWFIAEAIAMFLTFTFFKHAQKRARSEAKKARVAAQQNRGPSEVSGRGRSAA
jgi:hypothetical protein